MQLNPRYGDDPIIVLEGPPGAVGAATVRQRRRLAAALAELTDEQWAHPSRCAGWSARDVIVHLDSTNAFWNFSIGAGLQGEPTQFLATFDPVASPAQLVAATDTAPSEVLDSFWASTEALADRLESLGADDWVRLAESPAGHVSVDALTHHALWDSWVHERDVLLPLGATPVEEPDEVAACLRYAAALAPGLALCLDPGSRQRGVLVIEAHDPELVFTVEVDGRVVVRAADADDDADVRLRGAAVELAEALSVRRPLDHSVPADAAWLLSGIAETFEASPDAT